MTAASGRPLPIAGVCAWTRVLRAMPATNKHPPNILRCLVAGRVSNLGCKQSMFCSVGSALEIPGNHADGVVDQSFRGDSMMGQRVRLGGRELDDSMHEAPQRDAHEHRRADIGANAAICLLYTSPSP